MVNITIFQTGTGVIGSFLINRISNSNYLSYVCISYTNGFLSISTDPSTFLINPIVNDNNFPVSCTIGYSTQNSNLSVIFRSSLDSYSLGNDFGDYRIQVYVASIWIFSIFGLITAIICLTFSAWGSFEIFQKFNFMTRNFENFE